MDADRPPGIRRDPGADAQARIGLCTSCRHARVTRNQRGHDFWRCGRSDADPRFARYPATPVRACAGHEEAPAEPEPA